MKNFIFKINRALAAKKQKLITIFIALTTSGGAMFAESVNIGDLYYNLDENSHSAEVTSMPSGKYSGNISIPESVDYNSVTYNVTNIGLSAFQECSGLTSVTIPNGVTSIGDYAFYKCKVLQSVTIPNSITSIGEQAFGNCTGLTSVVIPNSVTSIGERAFFVCKSLTSIEIPNSITSIGEGAFEYCTGLTSIVIPNSVTSIGEDAFYGCSGLTSVTIGNSVTNIEYRAFHNCTHMTSIIIPNSVTSIGEQAFGNCIGLISIAVEGGNTTYDSRDNCNAIIETATNTLIRGCQNTIIPNSVTSIGDYAFYGGLTSVTIPNSVTSIGNYAFFWCVNLTSIVIPNSVTSIGDYAFISCTGLTSVTLGHSVTSIGSKAFYGCAGLTSIVNYTPTPQSINENVFYSVNKSTCVLYVPAQSIDAYKAADVWKEFTNIQAIPGTEPTKYTITWQDEDGNEIAEDLVEEGETPVFTGEEPTKASDAEYSYEFAGWLPKIKPATKDICYTTFFERNKIETPVYTVNINGENCSLNISNECPAGTKLTVEAVADECFEFQKWSDNETANPRTITVTEDANLTAEFNKLRYTITGKAENEGGQVQVVNP